MDNSSSKNNHSSIVMIMTIIVACTISLCSGVYFFSHGNLNLAYFDANTRLNIARRIFDNLTPGFAQIGNVWPPFPQLLFVPLVYFDILWRTGIAGWIVSGISYILTAVLIYKTVYRVTTKTTLAFLAALSFMVNINVVYLQSTAMSESFFWLTLVASFYCSVTYIQQKKLQQLFPIAIAIFFSTLTRYEGYALLIASVSIICFLHVLWHSLKKVIESTLLIYILPASFGIILWSVYLWMIFGDPLYWAHYYGATPTNITHVTTTTVKHSIFFPLVSYVMAVANMAGIMTTILGTLSMGYVLLSNKINKETKLLLLFPAFLLLFMFLTMSKNTVIDQPFITLSALLSKNTNLIPEFNIRYGLNLLPYLIIFTFIAVDKIRYSVIPYILLIGFQTIAYFYTPYYLTYQLRDSVQYGIPAYVPWIQKHYDGGLILISALKHDPEMREMGLPYKTYIHEGTQNYWKVSLKNPARYARWVIFDKNNPDDLVTAVYLKKEINLSGFTKIYDQKGIEIYKIKEPKK